MTRNRVRCASDYPFATYTLSKGAGALNLRQTRFGIVVVVVLALVLDGNEHEDDTNAGLPKACSKGEWADLQAPLPEALAYYYPPGTAP